MSNNRYNKLKHCAYLVQYHIIWCPKFRYKVLNEEIKTYLKDILFSIAERYEFEILDEDEYLKIIADDNEKTIEDGIC